MKSKKINKIMIILVVVLVLFVGAMTIFSSMGTNEDTKPRIQTVTVERGDVKEELDASGTVKSLNTKVFFSPVNATINELSFKTGDVVQAGEQLVTYDLDDLERENQKAELNVRSGQYDYDETVNQSNKSIAKQAQAQANVDVLQAQVDDWQNYVYDLQEAIEEANLYAQEDAAASAAYNAEQSMVEYQQQEAELAAARDSALVKYNQAKTEYDMAMENWKQNPSKQTEKKLNTETQDLTKAQIEYESAQEAYDQLVESGSAGSYSDSSAATADTTDLQRELNEAQTTLADLQSELASEKAIADSDPSEASEETLGKLRIANNLSELEAKSVEELIEEGKKGIQAEFTGVISSSNVVEGATASQGMELFTLESTEEVSVEISVSKNDFSLLEEGQMADIEIGKNTYNGKLTKINRVANTNEKGTPTIGAIVKIMNPDENIFLGVDAKVNLHVAEASEVLLLPVEAVNIGSTGSFCYVLRNNVIEKQEIETGVSSDLQVEVTAGLEEGDLVIPDLGDLEEGMEAEAADEDDA